MRLNEIVGDTENDVFNLLNRIYVMSIVSKMANDSDKIKYYLAILYADKENLNAWILKSKRISDLYNKIPQV